MDYSKETLCKVYGLTELTDEAFSDILKDLLENPERYRRKVLSLYKQKEQTNSELCAKCKGKCCKLAPCHLAPSDLPKISLITIIKEIKKGHISIVKTLKSGWEPVYILRIRGRGRPISDVASVWGIECSYLTENGCELSYAKRPLGAKLLIPNAERCISVYDISTCQVDWLPYQELLKSLYIFYKIVSFNWEKWKKQNFIADNLAGKVCFFSCKNIGFDIEYNY